MTLAYGALRRHLRLSPEAGDGQGGGGGTGGGTPPGGQGEGGGEGGEGDDDDAGDEDEDAKTADAEKLREKLRLERRLRKRTASDLRRLQTEKEQRDKDEQDAQAEEARKKGEWETLATTEKSKREKAEADLKAEREARRRDRAETTAQLAASSLNFHKPEDVARYLDFDKVEYGDDGKPTNVRKLVETIAKDNPFLVKDERAPGLPHTPHGTGGGQNAAQSYIASRYGQPPKTA